MNAGSRRRLTVVLHDKPQSQRLLELATRIASQLQAEVEGVFVEDAALFRLTGLPFLRELKRDSFTEQRLDPDRLTKEWRAMAKLTREALESSATQAGLSWSFRVWRGDMGEDLAKLAMESPMLLLGRLAVLSPSRSASTITKPRPGPLKLGVILDSRESAHHLIDAVGELSLKPEIQLILFVLMENFETGYNELTAQLQTIDPQHHNVLVQVPDTKPAGLITHLKAAACDLLMISAHSHLLAGQGIQRRLADLPYPVVVVR